MFDSILYHLPTYVFIYILLFECFIIFLVLNFLFIKVIINGENIIINYLFRKSKLINKNDLIKLSIGLYGRNNYCLKLILKNEKRIILKDTYSKKKCIKYKEQISAMGYKIDIIPRDLLD